MRSIAAVLLAVTLSACGSKQTGLPLEARLKSLKAGYDASLAQAREAIPYAREFLRLYPEGAAYWSHYAGSLGEPALNMEALLYDRYQLSMQVPVVLQGDRRSIRSFGEPQFLLQEILEVKQSVGVGSMGAVTNLFVGAPGGQSRRFGSAEWRQVVARAGDLSILGIPVITNKPAPGFELLRADWSLRMKAAP